MGTSETNQNLIYEETNGRLNSGNACYHAVQNILSYRLLSKNVKIIIYKAINLHVILYGCETWCLIFRDEHRLSVFQNSLLRRIFGPKSFEVTGGWRNVMKSCIVCTLY
jgi:hypothetical protein